LFFLAVLLVLLITSVIDAAATDPAIAARSNLSWNVTPEDESEEGEEEEDEEP
jgi:hypothetical protein